MKRITKILLCVLCAVAAVLCVAAACFMLLKKQGSTTASSAASGASVSTYGKVSDFDYASFDYSEGLDDNGHWTGIRALDYVTLPEDVSALPLSKADIEPTETEIQTQIDTLLNQYATTQNITDRAAQSGDTVNIDYSGAVDGVAFTGGTATGYDLTLGSHTFIDGFEDQIIGHNIGDVFDVTVTFPEGYGDSTDAEGNTITLSGKEAVFSVTLNSISESVTPELTDEWVDSNFGISDDLHTVDQLRSYFNDALYATNYENAIVDYLMSNSTFKELPSEITSYYIRMFLNYYNQYATAYGMDLNAFAQTQGYTDADAMLAASDAYFEHLAKQDLILQAVAETKSLAPTQEELDDTYGKFLELADKKKEIHDYDLLYLVGDIDRMKQQSVSLKFLQVTTGTLVPTATVVLKFGDHERMAIATGNGPVDAAVSAIKTLINEKVVLMEFLMQAITRGSNDVGRVHVQVQCGSRTVHGFAAHTDTTRASIEAFLDALRVLNVTERKEKEE